ncbi:MAG: GNAT family N-acetyltransferase [Lachnoclostridium sp.]
MKVISYETVDRFLDENKTILLEREAESQLILYNALVNQEKSTNSSMLFGRVEDYRCHPVLIFANIHPYNLVIHPVRSSGNSSAAVALSDYITAMNIEINGINARKEICDAFMKEYWKKKPEYDFSENLAMNIMKLSYLKEIKPAEGKFRNASLDDIETVAEWMVEFATDALGECVLYDDQVPKANRMIESNRLFVFENPDGDMVSMAAIARQLVNGACINYVYTPDKFRGKGYATANVYYLSKLILDKGNQFCSLFVDKKNPISNRVYHKIGYEIIEEQYDYRLIRCNSKEQEIEYIAVD